MLSLGVANKMIRGLEGSTTQNTSCKGRRLCSHYPQCAHNSPLTPLPGQPNTLLTFIATRHTCGILTWTWTCTCVYTHRGKTSRLNRRYQELIITNTWLLKQCTVYICEHQRSMRISSDLLYLFLSHPSSSETWLPTEREPVNWLNWLARKTSGITVRSGKCCGGYCIWLFTLVLGIQTLAPLYYAASTLPTGPSARPSRLDDCMVNYR